MPVSGDKLCYTVQQPLARKVGNSMRILTRMAFPVLLASFALAGVLLLLGQPAAAARPSTDRTFPGAAPCDTTLQACINGSANGDVIHIQAGTYPASVTLDRAVSLIGAGSGSTTLTALSGKRVITVTGVIVQASTVISGMTLTGGDVSGAGSCPSRCGAGLLIANAAQPALTNLRVTSNRALFGGGIYAGLNSRLTLSSVDVISNTAYDGAGAYFNDALVLQAGRFERNVAQGSGGGLVANSTLTATGTLFNDNDAAQGGGAAVVSRTLLTGATFSNNTGAGLFVGDWVIVNNTQFLSNTANTSAGGLYATGAITITGGEFRNNTGNYGGGVEAPISLAVNAATFISNSASLDGGGAYAGNTASLTGAVFTRNTTTGRGGGLYAVNTLTLSGASFYSNTAAQSGGGAYATTTLMVTGGTLAGNRTSLGSGGGLFAQTTLTLNNTQLISNTAAGSGGGVYATSEASVTGALFDRNYTFASGGGLYANRYISVSTSMFMRNYAYAGGAGLQTTRAADVSGSQFLTNTVGAWAGSYSGGGLRATGALTVTGSRFAANRAYNGGGLIAQQSLVVRQSAFVNNTAHFGGGLYLAGSGNGLVVNSLFARNMADGGSAALHLLTTGSVSLMHVTIGAPTQIQQQAIAVYGGSVTIVNTIVANHTVGIQNAGGTVTEDYDLFAGNTTNVNGFSGGAHSFTGYAGFVNPAADDYHLNIASDAINRGTNAGVTIDYDGEARPQGSGYEIGFDERASVGRYYLMLLLYNTP
jgi:predicted outer membrane repeat protein